MKKTKIKPTVKTVKNPVYDYFSVCCSVPATKPPCMKVGKKEAETQGLGSWRCTACRKPCSCTRRKNKPEMPLDTETTN